MACGKLGRLAHPFRREIFEGITTSEAAHTLAGGPVLGRVKKMGAHVSWFSRHGNHELCAIGLRARKTPVGSEVSTRALSVDEAFGLRKIKSPASQTGLGKVAGRYATFQKSL